MHLNIDRFKAVNEALGHEAGDLLLSQVADRLRWSTRVEDTAVRLGADEFLVVAEDVEDLDGLRALADRLLSVLDEPFLVHEREINLSASVGLTLGSDMAPDDLLRQAQSALDQGQGRRQPRPASRCTRARSAHDDVDAAAAGDRPAARPGQRGAAAVLPADRAPGRRDAARLRGAGPLAAPHPRAAAAGAPSSTPRRTTGSPPSWARGCCTGPAPTPPAGPTTCGCTSTSPPATSPRTGFSELVADALEESGLAPERLELEITESTALFAAEATLHSVAIVTEPGVTLALDDFGTGYSAITALHRLPIHTLKIDRSFVADVVTEPATAALVQGLLQLGRGMGLQVIAEGIEDLDQAALAAASTAARWPRATPSAAPRRCRPASSPRTPRPGTPAGRTSRPMPGPALSDPPGARRPSWTTSPRTSGARRPTPARACGSAAVPQLDAFALPETAALPDADDLTETDEAETADDLAEADVAAPTAAELPYASVADDESPASFEAPPSVTRAAAEPVTPEPGFDPGVFRPSRAFLELRELLEANRAPESGAVPEPRESTEFGSLRSLAADPGDLSGLRPWLESFQERLGPPSTGGLPQVGDRG